MKRRDFIVLLGGTAIAWPFVSRAQSRKTTPRIGVIWTAATAEESLYLNVLTDAFHGLGYFEGKNIELQHRFPAGQPERFRAFAQELVDNKVDIIIAATGLGAKAAKQATSTIPIVIVIDPDPVGNGLVASLAHPGGNVTGLSVMSADLSGKRLSLLKEAIPQLARVAVVLDPRDPYAQTAGIAYVEAAKAAGLSIRIFEVTQADGIEQAFSAIAAQGFDGAIVVGPTLFNLRAQVGASVLTHRVPTITANSDQASYGMLFTYGSDWRDYYRRAAGYVDKILKGARPGDLPVEQPTRFKLIINAKTAGALGLFIPPSLVSTADEVIE